ncbi:hypothetical protein L842_0922 [Mycobacterium intracellulare MIN_052511_1280]|nr:hypothetical protein L842_0922 [Mycobacterium intracellulare MIN_052511_1280]
MDQRFAALAFLQPELSVCARGPEELVLGRDQGQWAAGCC